MLIAAVILKVIGIILLVIACIVAVILFAPLVYRAGGDSQKKTVNAKISWLAGLIRFRFSLNDGETEMGLYLARWKLLPREDKEDDDEDLTFEEDMPESEEDIPESKLLSVSDDSSGISRENAGENRMPEKKEETAEPDGQKTDLKNESAVKDTDPESEPDGKRKEKKKKTSAGFWNDRKKSHKKKKSRHTGRRKQKKHTGAVGTVFSAIRQFRSQQLGSVIFPAVQRFLVRIRPRVLTGDVAFGLDNPADTGMLCGAIALIPYLFASDLTIVPDFETDRSYLKGNARIRGHVFGIDIVILAVTLLKNKKIRKFISSIRHSS